MPILWQQTKHVHPLGGRSTLFKRGSVCGTCFTSQVDRPCCNGIRLRCAVPAIRSKRSSSSSSSTTSNKHFSIELLLSEARSRRNTLGRQCVCDSCHHTRYHTDTYRSRAFSHAPPPARVGDEARYSRFFKRFAKIDGLVVRHVLEHTKQLPRGSLAVVVNTGIVKARS